MVHLQGCSGHTTSYSIVLAIIKLFNMSISSGKLPTDWKLSLVVPISELPISPAPTSLLGVSQGSVFGPLMVLPMPCPTAT